MKNAAKHNLIPSHVDMALANPSPILEELAIRLRPCMDNILAEASMCENPPKLGDKLVVQMPLHRTEEEIAELERSDTFQAIRYGVFIEYGLTLVLKPATMH